jgi:hypothetical protein
MSDLELLLELKAAAVTRRFSALAHESLMIEITFPP